VCSGFRRQRRHLVAILILGMMPLACIAPEPPSVHNPFIGTWVTPENDTITIRQDTIVQHQANSGSTVLDRDACGGMFRFGYDTKSRQALTSLISRQADLRKKLSELLVEPSYPVAELVCDRGDQTYVLLNDRQLVAIYRDGDIGAIDRLSRR
jgi:hypothetical protein